MKRDQKSLSALIEQVALQAIRESLGPLLEDEKMRQKDLEKDLKDLRATKGKDSKKSTDEDLEEAETEDGTDKEKTDREASEKTKVVSKKMATGKAEPEAPKAIVPDPSDIKDVTFDQVITLMNMMRSGKSARDPRTKDSLKDYFKGLNSGERQALFVLLSGLAQILAGGVEGENAPDPAAVGIRIKPKAADRDARAPKATSASTSPGAPPSTGKSASSKLGTSEPVPIVVGEASNRNRERKIFENLKVSSKVKS